MALPRSLPRLARLALSAGARAASDAPSPPPRDSCTPAPAPPCPPCVPHPRPPCRARPADRVQALRVTCCPPPRGVRPPCAPPLPACALDCTQAKPQKGCQILTTAIRKESSCDAGPDRVAARLAASKDWRRREYMREVCERRPPNPACLAPYRLPAERECARATDGNQYTIAPTPSAPPTPASPTTVSRACGPCRTPPSPKCVELVPDNECQVRASHHVDPCAHRPKVIVSIDRSKTREANAAPLKPSECAQRSSTGGITSRIMKSLNLSCGGGGGGGESSSKGAPRPSSGAGGKAQYAGDTSWCGKIQPVPAAPRCRPPGQAERLRRRACRDMPCRQQPPNTRTLHTAIPARTKKAPKDMQDMAAQTKANVEKLEKMLNTRASFKEAAKGRVVDCAPKVGISATGGLELPVPPGAAAIRVKVSLDPARSACAPLPSSEPPPPPCAKPPPFAQPPPCAPNSMKASPCAARAAAASCGAPAAVPPPTNAGSSECVSRATPTDDKSWLSIKTLQKKIAATCRMTDTSSKDTFKNPCQPKPSPCANPCQPKPSTCAPAPKQSKLTPPCVSHAPPKAPSKKSNSDKKKKKPTCFTPALSTHVTICT